MFYSYIYLPKLPFHNIIISCLNNIITSSQHPSNLHPNLLLSNPIHLRHPLPIRPPHPPLLLPLIVLHIKKSPRFHTFPAPALPLYDYNSLL